MRFFLAGIMQGSHLGSVIHHQGYRDRIKELLKEHLPQAECYDPHDDHRNSLEYDDQLGRTVFFHHNQLCRQVDVVLAFVPQASMGTAIEMWEAYQAGRIVVTVSPLEHNWAVKFLSHVLYADLEQFETALTSGQFAQQLAELQDRAPGGQVG